MKLTLFKKIVPKKVKAFFKLGKYNTYYKRTLNDLQGDNISFLIGTPIHKNLGDHLITLAELQLLEGIAPNEKLIEIPSEVFVLYKKNIRKIVKENSRIYVNGGGWMGNLWPNEERLLQDIVRTFSNNKIIIFPQTVFYDTNKSHYTDLIKRANNIFNNCKDIKLFVRDLQSLNFIKTHFNINVELVPDIALLYRFKINFKSKKNVIGLCLRDDRERLNNTSKIKFLLSDLDKYNAKFLNISTLSDDMVFSFEREAKCIEKLIQFSECSLIVTDRLHGMIYSYLAKTPCIVLENKTGKVSGVYLQWLKRCASILPLFDSQYSSEVVNEFLSKFMGKFGEAIEIEGKFASLVEEIRNG